MMSIRPLWRSHVAWWLSLGLCACQPSEEPHTGGTGDATAPIVQDSSVPQEAAVDADLPDAGQATAPDAALDSAISAEAAVPDAAADGGASSDAALNAKTPSAFLSETGLYSDVAQKTLAAGVQPYDVRLELWSDGATKKRYLYLPPGTKIDTTDPDAWIFPVGTKVWKEFTRDGVRVETRLIEKTASGRTGWKYVAYTWNMAQTAAQAAPRGAALALGTPHDVPRQADCESCHVGSPDFVLGVSAFGLPIDAAGVSIASLVRDGLLTKPITAAQLAIPGDAAAQAALGVLHVNCGSSCHRPGTFAWERTELDLRLKVGTTSVQDTPTYKSSVGVKVGQIFENIPNRITAGKPAESAVYTRMISRADMIGMPTIGTKIVDTAGSQKVFDWIKSLAP